MKYYTITPPPALSNFVRYYWVLEGEAAPGTPFTHRSMADGSAEMVFHYRSLFRTLAGAGEECRHSVIDGQASRFREYTTDHSFGIFGAYLFPYTVPVLFGIPAAGLSNQMPDLPTVLGQQGRDLEEAMMLAADNKMRSHLLSRFLMLRLKKNEQPVPAVFSAIQYIIQTKGKIEVSKIAERSFLSTRQFERNFQRYAGFSPKLYSRITRFQQALARYGSSFRNLTDLAYECGYYDQSHFIHDFKTFSGFHPRHFFGGITSGSDWRTADGDEHRY